MFRPDASFDAWFSPPMRPAGFRVHWHWLILGSILNRPLLPFLRILLPLALLLAQHGVWAHGFGHDLAKITAQGQVQDHATHACCLPFQAAGDAACGAPRFEAGTVRDAAISMAPAFGRRADTYLPYLSHAPPLTS